MKYAIIGEGGFIENCIEVDPDEVMNFAQKIEKTLIADDNNYAEAGGTWDGKQFVKPPDLLPVEKTLPLNLLSKLTEEEAVKFKTLLINGGVLTQQRADEIFV